MSKLLSLEPVFVDVIPELKYMELGKIYISEEYETSSHLCACGECGWETVLPFGYKEFGWEMTINGDLVTFHPSIGNQQFPCKSHYWIKESEIEW